MPALTAALPFFPGFSGPKTYTIWPVWADSARAEVQFHPIPKKQALRLYHKARAFNRTAKRAGRYGGMLGSAALRVLESLIFDFLNYASGRLDPSYEAIARKTGLSRSTVAEALKLLKELRILHWLRRCVPEWIEGRFTLRQETNAYAVLPPSQWQGFTDPEPPAPPPDPSAWGATPMMMGALEEAASLSGERASPAAILRALESDPRDELAAAMGRLMRAREASMGAQT
jgi:hypothetical protein